MDISFTNSELKKLCENARTADRKLGAPSGKRLRSRLADLDAASTLGDMPAGRPHPLKGQRLGQFAVRLAGGQRLVFEPTDDPLPLTADGKTNWQQVSSIKIVFVGDYHD